VAVLESDQCLASARCWVPAAVDCRDNVELLRGCREFDKVGSVDGYSEWRAPMAVIPSVARPGVSTVTILVASAA
jgi:hypothetical protein